LEEGESRLEVSVHEPAVDEDSDSVEADEDAEWPGDSHFCTPNCLAAWAMGRAINPTT
jgi:hypothetical protein